MRTSPFLITLLEQLCVCLVLFLTAGLLTKPTYASCGLGATAGDKGLSGTCSVDSNTLEGVFTGTGTTNTATLTLSSVPATNVTVNAADSTHGPGFLVAGIFKIPATGATISLLNGVTYQNGTLSTGQICGLDQDNDGYPAAVGTTAWTVGTAAGCSTNYRPLAALTSITTADCNDNDHGGAHVWLSHAQCYPDMDQDTYTVDQNPNTTCLNAASCNSATAASASTGGATVTSYSVSPQPQLNDSPHLNALSANDCDDTDPSKWVIGTYGCGQ